MELETITSNALVLTLNKMEVEPETQKNLLEKFQDFFSLTEEWAAKANAINITSIEQKEDMKAARTARLALKDIRVRTEATRKSEKEASLRKGQTIDAIAKIITNQIIPIEESLEQKEKFAEIQDAKKKSDLRGLRTSELLKYDAPTTGIDLGEINEETFQMILSGAIKTHEDKKELERLAEVQRVKDLRIEAEKKELERIENEKIRVENERLKAEAQENEKALQHEREKAAQIKAESEKKAKIEREARENLERKAQAERNAVLKAETEAKIKAEAELKAIKDAKAKEESARIIAEKKAAAAPDKVKLNTWVDSLSISGFDSESLKTESQIIAIDIFKKFEAFKVWAKSQIETL